MKRDNFKKFNNNNTHSSKYALKLYIFFTGGLCLLIAGTWKGWTSPFLHKLETGEIPFNLTVTEESWVVSLLNFGSVVSPIPTVYIMDILGRKSTFLIVAVIYQLSWLLTIFSNGAFLLCVSRFLAGIGEGICYTVSSMYLSEIAKPKLREVINRLFTVELFSGITFEFIIGTLASNLTADIVSLVIPIIFFILVIFIPESPYYLLMKNNFEDAYKVFSWLRNSKNENEQADEVIESELDIIISQVQTVILKNI